MRCRIIVVTRHKLFYPAVILGVVPIPEYIVDCILICYVLNWESDCCGNVVLKNFSSGGPESLLRSFLCAGIIPGTLMFCLWRNRPFSAHETVLLMGSCRSACMVLQSRIWKLVA